MTRNVGLEFDRRSFLVTGISAGAAVFTSGLWRPFGVLAEGKEYELAPLPYALDALEPHIDKATMEIHHGKHHAAYVKNLNAALKDQPNLLGEPLKKLLADKAKKIPDTIRQAVINNGGGHANHTLFWSILGPAALMKKEPAGPLADAIKSAFGDTAKLTEKMTDAGMKRFGSGWSWLVADKDGKLEVYSTGNQDSPIMQDHVPLLGIDVWEHAYYLKFQNKRAEYLKAIWNVVNWEEVGKRYAAAGKGDESSKKDDDKKKEEEARKKAEEAKKKEEEKKKTESPKAEAKKPEPKKEEPKKEQPAKREGWGASGDPASGGN